ncbi:PREDICTED: uncharacterized protein LOC109225956 [Nicotiana attenuata]|uniref:uncharacterized protein LOC109225956 n=1 Tax=Nicotiana attenuata TaxID=49451 RepID=UPI000904DFAD|nr:PREDICTED: uncharacterized protein LOC109225956 [Nicotiana attenuata]
MTGAEATPTITATGSTSQMKNLDSNHPYFLHSSDSPGMSLVNVPFDGRGSRVGGDPFSLLFQPRKNLASSMGFVKNLSLTQEIILCGAELMICLEHRFGQSNGAKLYQLQKEISTSVQGNNNISSYFTTPKKLWDEMDSLSSHLNCSCDCACGRKAKVAKFLEDQRILQFLMGLNDVYAQARGNILIMSPLPSMDFSYSLLLQDENQREVFVNMVSPQLNSDASSFMVAGQGKGGLRYNNQGQRGGNPSTKSGNNQQQKSKAKKAKYNPNVSCTHCMRTGHVRADCYRLIGFPDIGVFMIRFGSIFY